MVKRSKGKMPKVPRGGYATPPRRRLPTKPAFSAGGAIVAAGAQRVGRTISSRLGRAATAMAAKTAKSAGDAASQYAYEKFTDAVGEITDKVVTKAGDIIENVKLPNRPGMSTGGMFPAITSESMKKSPILLGRNNAKVYTTKFVYGKPTSKSVSRFMAQEGSTTLTLEDTTRAKNFLSVSSSETNSTTLGNKQREKMTIKAGFNQRTYFASSYLNGTTVATPLVLNNLSLDTANAIANISDNGTVTEYAIAADSKNVITMSSLNSYNEVNVRVSLVSKRALDFSGKVPTDWHVPLQYFVPASDGANKRVSYNTRQTYPSALISHQSNQIQAVPVPRVFQYTHECEDYSGTNFTPYVSADKYSRYAAFMRTSLVPSERQREFAQCIVEPTTTWRNSPAFSKTYSVVKTFTKKLMPGDTWNLHLNHQLGSGIDITSASRYISSSRIHLFQPTGNLFPNMYTPLGYYVFIDIVGQPTLGFMQGASSTSTTDTTPKGEPIAGTSPCAIQVDVKSSIKMGTLSSNKSLGANPSNQKFATKLFMNDNSNLVNSQIAKKYNTDYNSELTKVFVQADTTTQVAGSIGGTLA